MAAHSMERARSKKSNLVLLFGALLVFGSFVVRDEMKDEYRSLADAVAATRSNYEFKNQMGDLSQQISYVDRRLNEIEERQMTGQLGSWGEVASSLSYLGGDAEQLRRETEYLTKLATLIQDRPKFEPSLNQIQTSLRRVAERASAAIAQYMKPVRPNDPPHTIMEISRLQMTQFQLTNEIIKQRMALVPIKAELDKAVDEIQSRRERSYTIVKWASILLFVIGWVFGLVTKLLGIPADGNAD